MKQNVAEEPGNVAGGRMTFAWEEKDSPEEKCRGEPGTSGNEAALPQPSRALAGVSGESVRGETFLRRVDGWFGRLDGVLDRLIPESLNPLARTGAIANTAFLIAAFTGVFLLFWYSPSVHYAYDSLESLRTDSPLGQLMRSLHRYSSDACMLFVVLHIVRVLVARKFTGARSLAWVTGVFILGVLLVIGWTGYWLVWDERAQQVALGAAKMFDVLPVFAEPLTRSFLVAEKVPSLFFFLVFFVHMLLPLAIAVMLWLHLARVSRPKLFTSLPLTAWILGTLVVLSLVFPAESAGRADLSVQPEGFGMDWWYLWPLVLTDRLGGGALWGLLFVGTLAFCAVPALMRKKAMTPEPARVDTDACQGCTLCSKDCPFDAIRMVARDKDGKGPKWQALVDADKCVSCGICTGACDSDAIAMPGFEALTEKQTVSEWVRAQKEKGEEPFLAYVCGESTDNLAINAVTGVSPALPGYRVRSVPCAGWVSAPLLEHALQEGASGILILGCRSGEARYREGADWLQARLDGKRKPIFRPRLADRKRVRFLRMTPASRDEVAAAATEFRREQSLATSPRKGRPAAWAVGILLAAGFALATWAGSEAPYVAPDGSPELIVSFRHSGELLEAERRFTEEELERLPPHMRTEFVSSGERVPVRMRVYLDGTLLVEQEYRPRGLRRDGPSTAMERIELPEGTHTLRVLINDTAHPDVWPHEWSGEVDFRSGDRRVLLFGDDDFGLY